MIHSLAKFHTITKEDVIKLLVLILAVLIFSYSIILLSLTGNAISLKKISLSIKKTETDTAKNERDFSKTLTDVNSASFHEFGFTAATNAGFAVKKDSIASFALLYERN